ncbi:MAG: hypothetical protein H6Q13_3548 [Bacteroidetes bacterium]|nr:hypothetical protein [Bacteroidota bacterium]
MKGVNNDRFLKDMFTFTPTTQKERRHLAKIGIRIE